MEWIVAIVLSVGMPTLTLISCWLLRIPYKDDPYRFWWNPMTEEWELSEKF